MIPYDGRFITPVILAQSLHAIFAFLLVSHVATAHFGVETRRVSARGLLIETILPYALISALFMGTYCGSSLAANVFLPVLVQIKVSCYRSRKGAPSLTFYLILGHNHRPPHRSSGKTQRLPRHFCGSSY